MKAIREDLPPADTPPADTLEERDEELKELEACMEELGYWNSNLPWDVLRGLGDHGAFMAQWDHVQKMLLLPLPDLIEAMFREKIAVAFA